MSVIQSAAEWVVTAISGPITIALMTIAVAFFGLSMLSGQLSVRRGLQLVLGCFVLVGSAEIAGSLTGSMQSRDIAMALPDPRTGETVNLPPLGPELTPAAPNGNPFDPYAGGSSDP